MRHIKPITTEKAQTQGTFIFLFEQIANAWSDFVIALKNTLIA